MLTLTARIRKLRSGKARGIRSSAGAVRISHFPWKSEARQRWDSRLRNPMLRHGDSREAAALLLRRAEFNLPAELRKRSICGIILDWPLSLSCVRVCEGG